VILGCAEQALFLNCTKFAFIEACAFLTKPGSRLRDAYAIEEHSRGFRAAMLSLSSRLGSD